MTETKAIRTRFAPSPTGDLHIGGARTALFNFLFARGAGEKGCFILRIDDTDRERSSVEYEARIMEDLRWLGLEWDQGPGRPDFSGKGPWRQSERARFYEEALSALREKDAVYPCFCSEKRLEDLRERQMAKALPPRYDGACRAIPREEALRRIEKGERYCWRFALPDRTLSFHDQARGELSFAPNMGDFVVTRSDGQATYLFASAVDDRLMEITHIIRGDEHIPNTVRQKAIFDALGWPFPDCAHVPMILSSEDHRKLSKRTGSTPISAYRERGFLPEAICACLATLSWTPSESVSLFSLKGMAADFSLDRLSVSSPVHDEAHLLAWQKAAVERLGSGVLLEKLKERDPRFEKFDSKEMKLLIEDLLGENPTLPLLRKALEVLFERPPLRNEDLPWLSGLKETLRSADPWNEEMLNGKLRGYMKEQGLKGKAFFHPLRLILTGRESGSPLPLLMGVMGREETLSRLGDEKKI
ncbi:MAG: glutamate--tRNA ligase [Synergistaceae bacterium]|jgi:glutamyl-tRNA synthetase|nr:glutamate--tRNA ligase [Synergistaceae bacterium]